MPWEHLGTIVLRLNTEKKGNKLREKTTGEKKEKETSRKKKNERYNKFLWDNERIVGDASI